MSNEATVKLKLLLQNHITTPLMKAKQQLSGNVDEMKSKLNSLKDTHIKAFKDMGDEIPGFNRAMDLIKNPFVALTAGLLLFGATVKGASGMALDWEAGMAKINVTAGLTQKELGGLSNKLLKIGGDNVAPLEQIPEAFNKIISAGLDAKKSLDVLDPTLKAAKAGFTDVAIVAKAGVNVMKSSGEGYNKVMDVLFATLNKGNAEFADIANYLPKLVPISKQAGFALGEAAGAFAFMTAQGQSAEASTMLLENAFKVLSDPTKTARFQKMGISIYDAKGKMLPLVNIVKQLSGELAGLTDEQKAKKLASLGLDQQAASAFAIMSQNVNELNSTIDATTNSTGALAKAYTDSLTSTDTWQSAMNNVKIIIIKIGQSFLPIIKWTGEIASIFTKWLIPALVTVKNTLLEWYPVLIGIGTVFLAMNAKIILTTALTGILAAKTWLVATATAAWSAASNANWIGMIVLAVGALIGAIVVICKKFEGWGTVWNALKVTLINGFKQSVANWKYGITSLWLDIQIFWARLKGFGEYVGQLFSNIGQAIKLALTGNFAEAKKMLTQKIVTKSEAEIKVLEAKKTANTNQFVSESKARIDGVKTAWANAHLTRKAKGASTANADGTATDVTSPAETPTGSNPPLDAGADKVAGSAQQIKNLTVNIDSFNKGGINTQNTELQHMDGNQIADWFDNAMLRMIRNLEMTY